VLELHGSIEFALNVKNYQTVYLAWILVLIVFGARKGVHVKQLDSVTCVQLLNIINAVATTIRVAPIVL